VIPVTPQTPYGNFHAPLLAPNIDGGGQQPMTVQVLVVEDDPDTREFFCESVMQSPALALAAGLASVSEAKSFLDHHSKNIDVLLIDLGLPDGSGLEVIRHAKLLNSAAESLVISMFGDEDNVLASIEAGALGYIHKDESPANIAQTILSMRAGASPISPLIARMVLDRYKTSQEDRVSNSANRPAEPETAQQSTHEGLLSKREKDVLDLISRGYSYGEIGRMREMSINTVQTHIKSLYRKLAVNSKTEAVFEATRMGLLPR
jgi:DNA-binding NarL/FixJ family response regulator